MILQIRGSSCSGKSSIVQRLVNECPHEDIWENGWKKTKPRLVGHAVAGGLFIAGGYPPGARFGGLDSMLRGRQDLVTRWLEAYGRTYDHMIYEALTASTSIARYWDLGQRLEAAGARGCPVAYGWLDTPQEVVIDRLLNRSSGDVNLEDTGGKMWARMSQVREKYLRLGGALNFDLDYTCAYDQVVLLLRQYGWDPSIPPEIRAPNLSAIGPVPPLTDVRDI